MKYSHEITLHINAVKARVEFLRGMMGDCTINQRKEYTQQIEQLLKVQNKLVTDRMNIEEEEN